MSDFVSELKEAVEFLKVSTGSLKTIDERLVKKNDELITLPRDGRIQLKDIAHNRDINLDIATLLEQQKELKHQIEEKRDLIYDSLIEFKNRDISFDFTTHNDFTDILKLYVEERVHQSNNYLGTRRSSKPTFRIILNGNVI